MINKTKSLFKKLLGLGHSDLTPDDVREARAYIAHYWKKLERSHKKDDETLIGLPNPYLVPAYEEGHAFDFNEMYYWDSYFMVQGMLDQDHKKLVMGMLENLLSMQKRFGVIPNASRTYLMGRSQPPLLTSFIMDVYEAYKLDKKWLKNSMAVAEAEYNTVWMGEAKPNWRQVHKGLSRYYDINMLNDLAEAESGWDMTPRFGRRALDFLPVDLNGLLYKYEKDFARAARILGDEATAKKWRRAADHRRHAMDKLMWSELKDLYYDYNYAKKRRGTVSSLAAYFPMWAGMVDDKKAKDLVKSLKKFEQSGGLATTEPQTIPVNNIVPGTLPTQWAYPNGWAPLHFITVQALKRYGFEEEARRIALKWLRTNLDWFNKNGVFLEKYNVVNPSKPPVKGVYPSQTGFGWTNAIFERFCQEFVD